jgi:hypothetical protein
MKLDPITLRLFVAVMEENAIACRCTRAHRPSAASRRLAELEDQLQRAVHPQQPGQPAHGRRC